jgi:hypothetical protein
MFLALTGIVGFDGRGGVVGCKREQEAYSTPIRRTALCDYLTRAFAHHVAASGADQRTEGGGWSVPHRYPSQPDFNERLSGPLHPSSSRLITRWSHTGPAPREAS